MTIEQIAKIAHEVNRAYCQSLHDYSQKPWDDAPEWQKKSAINGVKYHLDDPDVTPEESHENWRNQKYMEGWKHSPVKDEAKKEHPCMVMYEDLPQDQKAKDYIFSAVVKQLVGFMDVCMKTPEYDNQVRNK